MSQDADAPLPQLAAISDDPVFNTSAVVHRTGVPAPTLRAWERRYGVLHPRRGENDYRRYSERDIAIIEWLRERITRGMTISHAIALLETKRHQPEQPSVPESFALGKKVDQLMAACLALDEVSARATIAEALAVYGVEEVCLSLLLPTLEEIGARWSAGELTVTVEHFASGIIRAQLESLFHIAANRPLGPIVLVGCAPGELHELGALLMALFLRRAGVRVIYLGQSVEGRSLVRTVSQLRPAAVLLSATMTEHLPHLLATLRQLRQLDGIHADVYVGGQAIHAAPGAISAELAEVLDGNAVEVAHELSQRLRLRPS
ncbi:MAG TPA: cobalamin B12-binding domain-containing protein [Ktedonobacterales bacterium]